jgi:hypothetical protein
LYKAGIWRERRQVGDRLDFKERAGRGRLDFKERTGREQAGF